jgi:hypothetical protein
VVDRLVRSFRKGRFFSSKRPERLLQELFTRVFVKGSRNRGIIPEDMILTGEGPPIVIPMVSRCVIAEVRESTSVTAPEDTVMSMRTEVTIVPVRLYRKRTVSERVNKRYNDFGLDTTRVRDNCYWYHLAYLSAMNMHLDAWVKQELDKTGLDKKSLLLHFLGVGTTAVCV